MNYLHQNHIVVVGHGMTEDMADVVIISSDEEEEPSLTVSSR